MAAAINLKLFLYFSHDSIYLALWWRRREIYNYFYIFLMIINNCIINITIRHRQTPPQRHNHKPSNQLYLSGVQVAAASKIKLFLYYYK